MFVPLPLLVVRRTERPQVRFKGFEMDSQTMKKRKDTFPCPFSRCFIRENGDHASGLCACECHLEKYKREIAEKQVSANEPNSSEANWAEEKAESLYREWDRLRNAVGEFPSLRQMIAAALREAWLAGAHHQKKRDAEKVYCGQDFASDSCDDCEAARKRILSQSVDVTGQRDDTKGGL
jgi:hypothetical protein